MPEILLLKNIIRELTTRIRKQDFLTYFRRLSIVRHDDHKVVIGVVSGFVRDNVQHKFAEDILAAVRAVVPTVQSVEIVVDNTIDNRTLQPNSLDCHEEYKELNSRNKKKQEESMNDSTETIVTRTINEKHRLDNFIVGPSNQLAHAAAEAVARRPGAMYNPLYIYGDVGLGKTHLLQAIANATKKSFKEKKVVYTTADRFISDYIASVKSRTIDKLRDRYRAIDVLVIDDIQFLAKKIQTQEELYNIFNILYESGKQIVLSSDRPPKELTELEPRLRSRFEWGITVDISSPDFETRLAILQEKSRERAYLLPQAVAEYIAYHTSDNVRSLEGILNQLIAEYELHNTTPTVESITKKFNKLGVTDTDGIKRRPNRTGATYGDLIDAVSNHFGIDRAVLLGDDRRKENAVPRQVAMYLLKNKLNFTYERIGNIFSGRNHSAILYSCRKLETILKKDQNLYHDVTIIRDKLGI